MSRIFGWRDNDDCELDNKACPSERMTSAAAVDDSVIHACARV